MFIWYSPFQIDLVPTAGKLKAAPGDAARVVTRASNTIGKPVFRGKMAARHSSAPSMGLRARKAVLPPPQVLELAWEILYRGL
jgi:hypothetical protein